MAIARQISRNKINQESFALDQCVNTTDNTIYILQKQFVDANFSGVVRKLCILGCTQIALGVAACMFNIGLVLVITEYNNILCDPKFNNNGCGLEHLATIFKNIAVLFSGFVNSCLILITGVVILKGAKDRLHKMLRHGYRLSIATISIAAYTIIVVNISQHVFRFEEKEVQHIYKIDIALCVVLSLIYVAALVIAAVTLHTIKKCAKVTNSDQNTDERQQSRY